MAALGCRDCHSFRKSGEESGPFLAALTPLIEPEGSSSGLSTREPHSLSMPKELGASGGSGLNFVPGDHRRTHLTACGRAAGFISGGQAADALGG